MVDWPDAPPDGGDAADAVDQGVNAWELVKTARPWQPQTFNLSELLEKTSRMLRRYVVVNEYQLTAIALWVAHTHAFGAAECTPYISINSVEKQSGKTRLLEVLKHLVANVWMTGHVTASTLVRKIAIDKPTLLLDETDTAFKGQKEYWEHVRGVLNEGYALGGVYSMSVPDGKDWKPKNFTVFCAKAFAGIGQLPDTVRDRSISIQMRRRASNEHVDKFRRRKAHLELAPIHDAFSDWAMQAAVILEDAEPDMPSQLSDRAQDVWEPLIAIADLAGDGWPERAKAAAIHLSTGANNEDSSLRVMLLRDIKSVFDSTGKDRIHTTVLVTNLVGMDEAPWGDLKGRAIDNRRLARMLKPFAIKPSIWRDGEKTIRGYRKVDFVDTWVRYVPSSATTETSETDGVSESSNVSLVSVVADKSEDTGGAERWTV